jgi:enamine deaminase RidA (YjgF/YER057c/UK114 family)
LVLKMGKIDKRLAELGIALPAAAKPVASYVPWVKTGNLVFVAGQLPTKDGKLEHRGQVFLAGTGAEAARLCALNVLAQLHDACGGDLDRVVRIVKVVGFVNGASTALNIPEVVNGASNLMVEVFGENGKHARSSIGVADLPLNASVEIEAIAEIA